MQFFAVLLPVATLLATTANAADCSSDSGSQTCLNSTDLLYSRWEWRGDNGQMGTFKPSNIPNEQSCYDSTLDIIDQCLGHSNSGTYSLDGWSMGINFCA
ncbi:uncharacterized protein N7458_007970 [Penicillium daleae]|uniref:Uncharacterized protein n=1 Tax=Penicillium daleae TaxID=63821 RepID=A0AAD6C4I0_9EURO|nr:uncharacterized protein N7458_007970 [Penicillium daleae]KAJ5444098.1 hypothetical protein N7458_007970 [Penicillium daleae]